MKSYLKGIILFDKEGSKRVVPLKEGINIITGESKTGKSALVEIIDYCLCSSRCTVPKGIITEFAEIYAVILHVNGHSYIVARQRWSVGGKMLFEEVEMETAPASMSCCIRSNTGFIILRPKEVTR